MASGAQRDAVRAELARLGRAELAGWLDDLPDHFLTARAPESIATHLVLSAEPVGAGQVWTRIRETEHEGTWELLVVARDRPGLLATMAGVLALRGLNVLAADAATTASGVALDAFTVAGAPGVAALPSSWAGVGSDLAEALSGREPIEARIARHDDDLGEPGPPPRVAVDNSSSPLYTVVEVRAPDRLGLLYHATRALYETRLDIHHAEIETETDGALDRFYVRGLDGAKLDDARVELAAQQIVLRLTNRLAATDRRAD